MKKWIAYVLTVVLCIGLVPAAFASNTALPAFEGKARLLVTQDGEVDDMNSLIHTEIICIGPDVKKCTVI